MNYALKERMQYLDWGKAKEGDPRNIIAADQEKLNLTWLAFPEIDEQGLEMVPEEFVTSIHEFMDKTTRAALATLPLSFMQYWRKESASGTMALTTGMPEDYLMRMTLQAHKAQARMVVREGNVIHAAIWKAA